MPDASPALFQLDGLATTTAVLTLFVGAIAIAFSNRYMRAHRSRLVFRLRMAALVACVLVALVAANMVVLAVAWIASDILLARLIGHDLALADAARARNRALVSFAIGDAALVAALALLAHHSGSLQIAAAIASAPALPPALALAVALLLVGAAAVRSALPPFSGWLLSSMTTPTPVSALMHAGLVNGAGFLLIRFAPVLEAAPEARLVAVTLGLLAALYGIGVMAVRPDVKRALAGSTVSQMGFMVLSCGLGAYGAALWHIVAHGLFKAWLFLGSGSAIGARRAGPVIGFHSAFAISGLTLLASMAAAAAGLLTAGFVPLALAAATAIATLAAAGMRPALAISGLFVLNIAGLALAHAAVGADGQPLIPPAGLVLLLAGLLAAWCWQLRSPSLPPRLYVRLLNAGA